MDVKLTNSIQLKSTESVDCYLKTASLEMPPSSILMVGTKITPFELTMNKRQESLDLNLLTERRCGTGACRLLIPFVFGGFATIV